MGYSVVIGISAVILVYLLPSFLNHFEEIVNRSLLDLKVYLLRQKEGLYMLVLLASPRWRWCPGEYLLVAYKI